MRALHYPDFGRLEVCDVPDPVPGHNEVILAVDSCGICGSELETFKSRSPRRQPPLVMGHEFCGTVVGLGPGVDEVRLGDRVVSNALVPCGTCPCCLRGSPHLCTSRQIFGMHRPGGFAQYVSVPVHVLLPWPEGLPGTQACLAEPLGNGVHVVALTRAWSPQRVLVIGAGPIGLMCQQPMQALAGAQVMVADLSPERLAAAAHCGASKTVNSQTGDVLQEVLEWTHGEGVDVVVDAVGSGATKRQAVAAARPGGAAVWIGLHNDAMDLDSYGLTLPEKCILGTYSAKPDDLKTALELLASRQVETGSWVKVSDLENSAPMFQRMLAAQGDDIKAVIQPAKEAP